MKKFIVTGMSCAACQSRVEKAVCDIDGVKEVSVSLLTNSMQVEGQVDEEIIINAVKKAGYGAKIYSDNNSIEQMEDELKDTETPALKRRLIYSLIVLFPLMYVSMGHMMWNWPLPGFVTHNHLYLGIIQFVLTTIVLWINKKFFINGIKGVLNKSPNMDTLVAMGAGASYGYSIYILIAMIISIKNGNVDKVMEYAHDFYFESAAMIVTLITVGKLLEAYSKGKTTNAIKGLIKLAPKTATIIIIEDNKEIERIVNVKDINLGDIFLVKAGESIPVDGVILEGSGAVDESALTGESMPVDKNIGDEVNSATINQSGYLKCKATRVGEDTTLSQIIKLVTEASSSKAPIAKVADKVSGIFVPVVIVIALITIFVWILVGETVGFALARGISVLVISCPCALGLATPVAIMVGNGVGAKNGILYKNATAIENAGRIVNIALDKTGTITEGKPQVTDVISIDENLLSVAYSLESKSEHPLGKAIVEYGKENHIELLPVDDFQTVAGNGLKATINGELAVAGNYKYISNFVSVNEENHQKAEKLAFEGETPMYFALGNKLLGIIGVADVIKEDSSKAIFALKNMGIKVIMLTGDNINTANAIGKKTGVDEVIAEVLPQDKEAKIKALQKEGITAMVGDGINDAPALTRADIGMAIGAGVDVAIDAADIVLVKNRLTDVVVAIRLSRGVLKNIYENLFWAFIYNVIGIPLAAGLWYPLFGIELSPMFGAAAMSLSSFCVVTNALRLNFLNIYSDKKDKKIKHKESNCAEVKKETNMEKVILINGMMCGHCEATVKKALELLPEVDEAIVSKDENKAVVKLNSEVTDDVLTKTITDKDFEVVGIE